MLTTLKRRCFHCGKCASTSPSGFILIYWILKLLFVHRSLSAYVAAFEWPHYNMQFIIKIWLRQRQSVGELLSTSCDMLGTDFAKKMTDVYTELDRLMSTSCWFEGPPPNWCACCALHKGTFRRKHLLVGERTYFHLFFSKFHKRTIWSCGASVYYQLVRGLCRVAQCKNCLSV